MTGRRKSTIVGQFIPHRVELIESPAWRVLSLSARRVIDRIEIEMCHHGGHRENGKLPVTFDDFVRHGVRRNSVASAIREAVALCLVVITEQGRGGNAEFRSPNRYRLTYINTKAANPAARYPDEPTDDWKRIDTVEAAEHIAEMARNARSRPSKSTPAERKFAASKKQKSTPQNGTASPPISGGENSQVPPPISGGTGSVTKWGVLSISPQGASASGTLLPSRRRPASPPMPTGIEGFTSEDGTIQFTAADFEKLSAECPHVENVRGTVVNLAASDWIARKVAPYDRARAIRAKVKKLNREEAEKQAKVATPKQVAAVRAFDQAAIEAEYEERQKALAVRRRLGVR